MTSVKRWEPLSVLHRLAADYISLKTMAKQAARLPLPFGPTMPHPHGGEGDLDRVGGPQVSPVLGREVVEGEQHVAVLGQALRGHGILGFVGQEPIEGLRLSVRLVEHRFPTARMTRSAGSRCSRWELGRKRPG